MRTLAFAAALAALSIAAPHSPARAAPADSAAATTIALADTARLDTSMVRIANQRIHRLADDGHALEAIGLARAMRTRCMRDFGPESYETTKEVEWVLYAKNQAALAFDREAYDLAEQAVRLRRKFPGKDSVWLARSLGVLGDQCLRRGNFEGALSAFRESAGLRERHLGPDSPELALSLGNIAQVLQQTGHYDEARRLLDRADRNLRAKLGQGGTNADQLGMLIRARASFEERVGDLGAAQAALEEAYALHARDGANSRYEEVAGTLEEMSQLAYVRGDMSAARANAERARALRVQQQGAESANLSRSLRNLGRAQLGLGDALASRRTLETADSLEVAHWGLMHWRRYDILIDLAETLSALGDRAGARDTLRRALAIGEADLGADAPELAEARMPLATALVALDAYAEAESLLARSVRLHERINGAAPNALVPLLAEQARLQLRRGDRAAAAASLARAMALAKRVPGDPHTYDLSLRRDRAAQELAAGRGAAARADLAASIGECRAAYGPSGPIVAAEESELARALLASGANAAAFDTALAAEALGREELRATIRGLPEREALLYAEARPAGLGVAMSALLASRSPSPVRVRRAWDALIRSRALVLDEAASRRHARAARTGSDSTAARLDEARQRLANLTVRVPRESELRAYRTALDSARTDVERLERTALGAPAAGAGPAEPGADEVHAALPADAALVSFVRFERAATGASTRPEYAAFVLGPGARAPAVVALGSATAIDAAVQRWRAVAGAPPGAAPRAAERAARREGRALRARVWDPIAPSMGHAKLVLLVPDGALHLVAFGALPGDGSRWLVETGPTLQVLSAERDVAAPAAPPGRGMLAVGDPDFDALETLHESEPVLAASGSPFRGGCASLVSMRWSRLPASAAEAAEVCDAWRGADAGGEAALLRGAAASERAFKRDAPGHRLLHLATHGFFLAPDCRASPLDARGVGGVVIGDPARARPAGGVAAPPLCGLVFAGANRRQEAGPEDDDGILTTDELAALDLDGTEWVVLSACETGVGEVRAGEGVFGLRRALRVAGARTSIVSLWAVRDAEARAWMRALYQARFRDRLSTAESVRAACVRVLAERRKAGLDTHPFAWAGFIAAGDWR